ncbi:hypothetical protein C3489_24955, partial [Streptomyces sp. Ru71]|uniref:hypothetical protein n=1 Tax=Streptomyces sp. Ru71 TaxID=2080746 RepID=UPI000CDD976F
YLDGLLLRLDAGDGWCGVFWQRDPDGMRACHEGREVPPWDVVEALLQDLAARYDTGVVAQEAERARALHAAAVTAYDARPGGREALADRLDVMLREQRYAAERQAALGRALASAATRQEADALRLDLAWSRDDHERATARCAELRARMARLDRRDPGPVPFTAADATGQPLPAGAGTAAAADWFVSAGPVAAVPSATRPTVTTPAPTDPTPTPAAPAPRSVTPAPATTPPAPPTPAKRKRRRGGARFAGAVDDTDAPTVVPPPVAAPVPAPALSPEAPRTPRGARFAGAVQDVEVVRDVDSARPAETVDAVAERQVTDAVDRLARLRAEGRTGEAHVLLVELARWPAARFPLLAARLHQAGLGADWVTLLWEAASLPAERLVAAADALVAAGRGADGEQILRQGVARPAEEIAAAVRDLHAGGRHREVGALLGAYVRVRAPEEAARCAAPDPSLLVPLLLQAARGVSDERHWDLLHALRVAGLAT